MNINFINYYVQAAVFKVASEFRVHLLQYSREARDPKVEVLNTVLTWNRIKKSTSFRVAFCWPDVVLLVEYPAELQINCLFSWPNFAVIHFDRACNFVLAFSNFGYFAIFEEVNVIFFYSQTNSNCEFSIWRFRRV